MLDFDSKAPQSFDQFLSDCHRHLTSDDYDLVCAIFSDQDDVKTNLEGLQRLIEFNRGFRNDLVYFRAERARKDPSNYMKGQRTAKPYHMEMIQQAANETNLLDSQKAIDRFKWKMWDDLSSNCHFGLELIVVYGLKIRMLEMYQDTRTAKGAEVFEALSNPEFLVEHLYQTPK